MLDTLLKGLDIPWYLDTHMIVLQQLEDIEKHVTSLSLTRSDWGVWRRTFSSPLAHLAVPLLPTARHSR